MNGNKDQILGIALNSTPKDQVLERLVCLASAPAWKESFLVFTPNPEFLVEADKDREFKQVLQQANLNLVDGIGLILAGKLFGQHLSRISGADMVEQLLLKAEQEKWTIGIVGARRGDPKEAPILFQKLAIKYPDISFVNLDNPKFQISNFKFQIVLACQGMKKQENWILENKDKIRANVLMGVGGSLDFITGFTKRAPLIMRRAGLEWLWRGIQRPSHFKRIWKATGVFGFLVVKEKLSLVFGLNSQ